MQYINLVTFFFIFDILFDFISYDYMYKHKLNMYVFFIRYFCAPKHVHLTDLNHFIEIVQWIARWRGSIHAQSWCAASIPRDESTLRSWCLKHRYTEYNQLIERNVTYQWRAGRTKGIQTSSLVASLEYILSCAPVLFVSFLSFCTSIETSLARTNSVCHAGQTFDGSG